MTTTRPFPVVSLRFREPAQPSTASERRPVAAYSSGQPCNRSAEEVKAWLQAKLSVSLPTSRCGTRGLAERARLDRGFDVHVHLLTYIQGRVLVFYSINDLENTRINPLGRVPGQRLFGDHIRLEADKLQGNSYRTVSTRRRRRRCSAAHTPGIVLIHIDTDVQRSDTSENHERLTERTALRKLAQPHFVLQNDACNWRAHGQTINVGLNHLDLSFRLSDFRFRDGNIGSPCARL